MKILVPVDKTEESQLALRYACHLMEFFPAHVDALYVKPDVVDVIAEGGGYMPFTSRSDVEREIEKEARKALDQIIESCEVCLGGKIPCNPMVSVGEPAEEILRIADEGHYDMIILGSQSHSLIHGLLLGAVQLKILHHAKQPILIMRNFRPIQKILVAYRGSQCDQGALEFIGHLFAKKKPEITILHVQETTLSEPEDFAETCLLKGYETLQKYGYNPVRKKATGDFVEEVLKSVAVERYDLLVLGAYGHRQPKYLKLISDEALNLVRLTTRPVLIYR